MRHALDADAVLGAGRDCEAGLLGVDVALYELEHLEGVAVDDDLVGLEVHLVEGGEGDGFDFAEGDAWERLEHLFAALGGLSDAVLLRDLAVLHVLVERVGACDECADVADLVFGGGDDLPAVVACLAYELADVEGCLGAVVARVSEFPLLVLAPLPEVLDCDWWGL